jgi:hydroxymethylpyrimidine/phosphomethylpyrimidine kinase
MALGNNLYDSIERAKNYIEKKLSLKQTVGKGTGPVEV